MTYPVKASISQNFGENPTANIRPGNPDYWIIQQFGNYQPDGHTGIDFRCKAGTEVRAVADGTVLHIGWMGGTYASNPWWVAPDFAGYCAVIDHGSFIGIYGHCKDGSAKVSNGARVREGQVFILSGNTGGSTGDHLHFEVLPDGYNLNARFYGRVNPLPYLGSASVGPAGDITQTTEIEDDMTPEDRRMLVALYDAVFNGGTSMPEGKPLKDLIHDNFTQVKSDIAKITTKAGA